MNQSTKQTNEIKLAHWANHALFIWVALFALTVPHSIAAAQISLTFSYIAWAIRDLAEGHLHFARTPIDRPLLCFIVLSTISSLFSIEPSESIPKLRSLTTFGVFYLFATNLHPRNVRLITALLIISSLIGVGYSFIEKGLGRGVIITSIKDDSPLQASKLQPGDVIWMIGRRRVKSLDDINQIVRQFSSGKTIEIEALHAGDPLPVTLLITDDLKTRTNPLEISVGGRSRRFRISGFSRHFQTYAEQMQILALLVCGPLLINFRSRREKQTRARLFLFSLLFSLFSLALILTASRAVIASFLLSLLITLCLMGGRRIALLASIAILLIGAFSAYVLSTTRTTGAANFSDDSTARRIGYMRAGLRLIPQHPILGVGLDSQKHHWKEWGFPGDYVTHTHSTPIQIALDRGLVALGCYLWLIAMMFAMVWRRYKWAETQADSTIKGLTVGAFAALTGFSISSLVNYNFGDSEVLMMLLLIIGIVTVTSSQKELINDSMIDRNAPIQAALGAD